jgi:hypothetical protein
MVAFIKDCRCSGRTPPDRSHHQKGPVSRWLGRRGRRPSRAEAATIYLTKPSGWAGMIRVLPLRLDRSRARRRASSIGKTVTGRRGCPGRLRSLGWLYWTRFYRRRRARRSASRIRRLLSSREVVHPLNGDKGDLITVAGYLFESRQRARGFSQRWKDVFGATGTFSWADLVACQRPI